jgi:hypothetical protein
MPPGPDIIVFLVGSFGVLTVNSRTTVGSPYSLTDIIRKRMDINVAFTREYSRVSISTRNERCVGLESSSSPEGGGERT